MKKTKERIPQVKTLEQMVVSALKENSPQTERLQRAYHSMYDHFIDEDDLHNYQHRSLLNAIYVENFYRTHTVYALEYKLHLGTKNLLEMRKHYLQLLTKKYLDLDFVPSNYRIMLYNALTARQQGK